MKKELTIALDNVEMTYSQISEISEGLVKEYTADISNIIKYASDNMENLTNDDLRSIMLKLALKAYSFGDIKEKSAIKATCAKILREEKQAKIFTETEGSVGFKDKTATSQTSMEIITEAVYNLVSNLFKIKLDEIRRTIDILKTILMSRLSEAKLSSSISQGTVERK